jgi:arylsulfatase A-like enzyme
MSPALPTRIAGVALAALLLGACGEPGVAHPPNVLLIVVDTLRRDHLSAYGYARETSPQIDRLAADAVRYDAAQSQAPWTLPSVAAILTGRDVAPLGIVDDENVVDDGLRLLSEALKEQGYTTGAIVSHKFVSAQWGFDQGFDHFDDSQALGHLAVTSPTLTQKAIAFLDAHQNERFFLFLHYFDPHFAYIEHEDFRFERDHPYQGPIESGMRFKLLMELQDQLTARDAEELRRLYDSEIAFTDHHIGRVLARLRDLGLYDDTLVILTGDHGEEFLEHGQIGHGKTLYEELVGVPLIVHYPGRGPGVVERPVALVDLFPTVLQLAGARPGSEVEGISLLEEPPAGRDVFSSTERRGGARAARRGHFKLIRRLVSQPELYDLTTDPTERHDLLAHGAGGTPPDQLGELRGALQAYAARIATAPRRILKLELTPEQRKQLEELGYLSGNHASP